LPLPKNINPYPLDKIFEGIPVKFSTNSPEVRDYFLKSSGRNRYEIYLELASAPLYNLQKKNGLIRQDRGFFLEA